MNEKDEKMPKTTLYKDTITDLNKLHSNLLRLYLLGQTRAIYLKQFELALSMNCPKSLWEMERYVRVSKKYPLPENECDYVSRKKFKLYMILYEYIMRDIGLIGNKKGEPPTVKVFDLND